MLNGQEAVREMDGRVNEWAVKYGYIPGERFHDSAIARKRAEVSLELAHEQIASYYSEFAIP